MTEANGMTETADETLARAVELFAGRPAFAFFYGIERFEMAALKEGALEVVRGTKGKVLRITESRLSEHLDTIYEMRLFSTDIEFHWSRQGKTGVAVEKTRGETHQMIERRYLLWGEADPPSDHLPGWSRLRSPRVRPFWVPVAAPETAYVSLLAIEHIARGVDGNAYIACEQLVGFEISGKNGETR